MAVPATPSTPDAPASTPSSEEKLQTFWKNYQVPIAVICVAVILGILGKGVWNSMQASKEKDTQADYAAATTPEALKTFAASHEGHILAAVASLQVADKAYADSRFSDAITSYQTAIASLPAGPILTRAKLGLAMAEIQGGRQSEGEASLHQLSADTTLTNVLRAEATYQLASLAAAAGRNDEAIKLCEQTVALDQSSQRWWASRAFGLRSTLGPVAAAPGTISLGK